MTDLESRLHHAIGLAQSFTNPVNPGGSRSLPNVVYCMEKIESALRDAVEEIRELWADRELIADLRRQRDELAVNFDYTMPPVENRCRDCGGFGRKVYGTTATWRGGVGGAMVTQDVCDRCWGSGDAHSPWPSHRVLIDAARAGAEGGGE